MLRPLLLTGGPAAGKSSCGRRLALGRERCAYVDADDVRQLVVSGHVAPWQGDEGRVQHTLGARGVSTLARELLAADFEVVASDLVTDAVLEVYRERLPDCLVVHLTIGLEAARSRAATRPRWITDDEFDLLHGWAETPPAVDAVIRVDSLSVEEQVARIRAVWHDSAHDE